MLAPSMQRSRQGELRRQTTSPEAFFAFIPAALPPEPPLDLDHNLAKKLSKADQMLGRLDGLSRILPHPDLLIYFYIRKEAVLSSQIEGTQSTLSDLLLFEMEPTTGDDNADVIDVSNYVAALRHGLVRMEGGFPLSLRLIREMHGILLQSGRGSGQTPGEFRTSQNWIGGSRPGNALYVPPPVEEMKASLDAFEKFMNGGAEEFPVLLQCAMIHLQFESIHPFLDGNGRIGRLLVTLLLIERGVLIQPMLYMSLYLKQNRDRYYALLQSVRTEGNWEEWVEFFLEGVCITSEKAVVLAEKILELFRRDEARLMGMGARRGSAIQVFYQLQRAPYAAPARVAEKSGLSFNTVVSVLESFREMGMLKEVSGRGRGRIFRYTEYLDLLDEGTVVG
jgi:Fic family protein